MSVVIVGTVATDTVATPFKKVEHALGGSATYIALAASYFTAPVNVVAVVGEDFPKKYFDLFKEHNIETDGIEIVEGGKTFHWSGKYHYDLNTRDTLVTELNVLEQFDPEIPEDWRKARYLCLGNIDPSLQLKVLDQMDKKPFTVCDTMNFWIEGKKDELLQVLKRVDVLIINDSEARLLADEPNLIKASKIIRELGCDTLIIKKGEHGALLFAEDMVFAAPAYPMEIMQDPTGAGDTFAGGFIGYLDKTQDTSFENIKRAVIYGSAMASFCVEEFSTTSLERLSYLRIQDRFRDFLTMTKFDEAE